jgi:uncharacterized protein (TIGR03083 family)
MADAGRDVVGPMVLAAWDDFLDIVEYTDLDEPTRLPGWRAHEVCVHLGTWPEHDGLSGVLASAREGRFDRLPDSDEINATLVKRYRDAPRQDVVAALRLARDNAAAYLDSADTALDGALAGSVVGPLPVLSVILGGSYELAVHALDLASSGAPPPSDELLVTGLAALAEVTAALASRVGVHGRAALHSPLGGWAFAVSETGWTVDRLGVEQPRGPAVEADAAALLDLSAGRINPVVALTRGHLRIHDLAGVLRLAPIVETVPGLPGGPVLRVAARTLAHLPRLPRWARRSG